MPHQPQDIARRLLRANFDSLSPREQYVIQHIAKDLHISRNTNHEFDASLTFGQRLADHVAAFGGSWTFILLFGAILLLWIALNSFVLVRGGAWDPYPYILLNLVLSMLAALQAPIIMMSQNRQAAKDRMDAAHDYQVNLKAELEIAELHAKLDHLRADQWSELIALQQEQLRLLKQILEEHDRRPPDAI